MSRGGGDTLRDEAARWWARMHGPDAEASRAAFEQWHGADPAHAAHYAALERVWDLAAGLGATAAANAPRFPRRPRPFGWATPARIGLGLAVMAVAALGVTLRAPVPPAPAGLAAAAPRATRIGEIRTITLPDGSRATLDTDTRLTLAFDGDVRRVTLLRGRARFDVRGDAARAFVVEAGGTSVSATDAVFDVQLVPGGLCLSALRGAVETRPRTPGPLAPPGLRLASGRMLRFGTGGRPLAPVAPVGKGSDQWVSGMLVFQGAPLGAVLGETNRYSARRIRLADPALANLRVTGSFRPLPVDALAAVLATAFGLRVREDRGGDLVLGRP